MRTDDYDLVLSLKDQYTLKEVKIGLTSKALMEIIEGKGSKIPAYCVGDPVPEPVHYGAQNLLDDLFTAILRANTRGS